MSLTEHRRALRDFQDSADDLSRARYGTFENALRRFVACLAPGTPLGKVAEHLQGVDFDTWYDLQLRSVGGMVGSGRLDWPVDRGDRVGLQLETIRRIDNGRLSFDHFVGHFLYVSNRLDDNIAEFREQVIRPFTRDFLRIAHETPEFSAALHPQTAAQPAAAESATNRAVGATGPIDRLSTWVEQEARRRGKFWGLIGAIVTIIVALLALI